MVTKASDYNYSFKIIDHCSFLQWFFLYNDFMNTREIGNEAESIVCKYLEKNGYSILDRNFRIPNAEIDIIATKNKTINFIEVKKIPISWDGVDIAAKISKQKICKIRFASSVYLAQHCKIKYDEISFDVAIVTGSDVCIFNGAF